MIWPSDSKSFRAKNPHIYGDNTERPVDAALPQPIVPAISTDEQRLNKTERAWLRILRVQYSTVIHVQDITLKLADDCRYTPDFWFVDGGQIMIHEVKGFFRDDAKVKIKVAARLFLAFNFFVVMKVKGDWQITPVKP